MGKNDPRAKRPTGETTHLIRANRPTPKTRAKQPRAKRPGETTHGRNDPDSSEHDPILLDSCLQVLFHNSKRRDLSAEIFHQKESYELTG